MKVSETKRDSMTFILAGYKEEILELLTYNPGFASRFPSDMMFEFPDYTQSQLHKILVDMTREKGLSFQKKKYCGVPIAKIMAQRIAKGAGRKGASANSVLAQY